MARILISPKSRVREKTSTEFVFVVWQVVVVVVVGNGIRVRSLDRRP